MGLNLASDSPTVCSFRWAWNCIWALSRSLPCQCRLKISPKNIYRQRPVTIAPQSHASSTEIVSCVWKHIWWWEQNKTMDKYWSPRNPCLTWGSKFPDGRCHVLSSFQWCRAPLLFETPRNHQFWSKSIWKSLPCGSYF